ncbi:multicopper oxidase family protein [Bacillus solimangrovi]|uniref:Copper oxidase n=1 Tax=Bacillus solimangrovi TaxID=1305675 RepID=A0A1E5LJI4_9BACI|nr:multicopper oxidase [Bacillus solimangrovi]OEH94196.1 copper oxidase [Bacillus solimangrovi]
MNLEKFVDPMPIMPILKPTAINNGIPYYEVTMLQCKQKLHRDLPPTKIWGYDGLFPGPTIAVWRNQKIEVLWKNELPRKHFLPIDTTVHGAEEWNPEVRTVVHLHGGATPSDSDGYPESWFTHGFEIVGPTFSRFVYCYPNDQPPTALWYHDHAMGITRLNIYAGLVGMYLIYDLHEQSLGLPKGPFEVPLVIQDRSFKPDGSLYYPRQPKPPVKGVDPSVLPDFFADTILVNGKVWPYFEVEPRKYRFRILNGSNARFYNLSLSSGQPFYQIGTDQGLLQQPVIVSELLLSPAERADIIIDFSEYPNQFIQLKNDAASPYPQGDDVDPDTTAFVMEFRVTKPLSSKDDSIIPYFLTYIPKLTEKDASNNRNLTLVLRPDQYERNIHLLDGKLWTDPISEDPKLGSIETWTFINLTEASHPIHLHLVRFQVLDRQTFDVDYYKKTGKIRTTGPKRLPDLNERGLKDTVRADPGEITRIIVPFGPYSGRYVWHCHILEHEDYEMMRPYIVIDE